MPAPALGLDFGTSNTAAAVLVDGKARVLELDPKAQDARLYRSVLFFPEEGQVMGGAEAIAAYLELSDGRFLQSLKSFLPVKSFTRTSIRHRSFTLEALIGLILRDVKRAIEAQLGEPVTKLVLGRPARFSEDRELDGFAERRLLRAAEEAGFKEIAFRIEPLAAGLAHEATLDHDELVLTGDFGAGTSDFTVMRLSPKRHLEPDRRQDILASAGVYVAGDAVDGAVMEHKLLRKFGSEARQRPMHVGNWSEMPTHLMRKLLSWHTMSFIREKSTQVYLEDFLKSTDQPEAVGALIDLVNRTRADHIGTVEDPIEFMHKNKKAVVNQREVGADTKSLANALKHVLRQDPDVILIGELRDLETISVALTAAETGHLVFATLHTQSAAATIDRVIDVYPPHQQDQVRTQLGTVLQGVVTQTLVKRASGEGRAVATEVLVTTPAISNLIREGKSYQITSMMQAGRELGMHTLDQHLADLVDDGTITREAAFEKSQDPETLTRLIQRTVTTGAPMQFTDDPFAMEESRGRH